MQITIESKTNSTLIETSENWTAIEDKRRLHVFSSRYPLSALIECYDLFQSDNVTDITTCAMMLDLADLREAA